MRYTLGGFQLGKVGFSIHFFFKGFLGSLLSEALCWVLGWATGYDGAGWQQALPAVKPLHPAAGPRPRDPERGEGVGARGSRSLQNASGKTWRDTRVSGPRMLLASR